MQSVQRLFNRLSGLKNATEIIIAKSFEESMTGYEEINRERMNEGLRADGSVMPYYSWVSQKIYGYPDAPIKLHDTGDFQAAIVSEFSNDIIYTESKDWKNDMLVNDYGKEIFGTGRGRSQVYRDAFISEYLKPSLNMNISELTGLSFR